MTINIPLKDYQFAGIIALIGTLMWVSIVSTNSINASITHGFIFAIGAIMCAFGTLATFVCFFLGDHVRFKS